MGLVFLSVLSGNNGKAELLVWAIVHTRPIYCPTVGIHADLVFSSFIVCVQIQFKSRTVSLNLSLSWKAVTSGAFNVNR